MITIIIYIKEVFIMSDNIEIQAAQLAQKDNPSMNVRKWLQECYYGTLGTISTSRDVEGFPMGSIVPFCLDDMGRPVILTASIAAHTRNLKKDNRATLFIHDPKSEGDPQSSWRASLMGSFMKLTTEQEEQEHSYAEIITKEQEESILARYIERVPKARSYLQTHDFSFWRLSNIQKIRYIAGFGRITWIPGTKYLSKISEAAFLDMERGALKHMNDDHQDNMKEMCKGLYSIEASSVEMVELNIGGCMLKTSEPNGLYYCSFDRVVESVGGYKAQIIKLLKKSRQINRDKEPTT